MKFLFRLFFYLCITAFFYSSCRKEDNNSSYISSNYSGSYKNLAYISSLLKEYKTGIYYGADIPDELRKLQYGRIEISFRYDGGGSSSFMPLFYYGSVNKIKSDDAVEETKFHLAIEIGHYNVIPLPVDYLFYTISTFRQPQYCRDSWSPVIAGKDYTLSIDKRPEGNILQLKHGDTIINSFPHAFFPDSSRMFFNDVTSYINFNMSDTLETVLMVGKGFCGFDKGLHEFHGQVYSLRIYSYLLTHTVPEYIMDRVKNQLNEEQELSYSIIDPDASTDDYIQLNYEFQHYIYDSYNFSPSGEKQYGQSMLIQNKLSKRIVPGKEKRGLYKISLQTLGRNGNILKTSHTPFEIWVYPKEWYFDSY
jgi:hypothetical protein